MNLLHIFNKVVGQQFSLNPLQCFIEVVGQQTSQTNLLRTLLHQSNRPTNFTDQSDTLVHQVPTQTQYFIREIGVMQNAARADYEGRIERQRQLHEHELSQQTIREQQQVEQVRQEAFAALHQQEQSRIQQEKDRAHVTALVQQVYDEANRKLNAEK